jgi:DNA-directed RNA polymerase specialized sigma24 family protein
MSGPPVSYPERFEEKRMQDIITKSCAAPSDDTELIMHLIRGEQNAQEEFVRRFQKLIRVVLSMRPLSRQEQEDLFQQVFVHLWENNFRRLHKWDSQKGRLCSFLGVVAARLAADYIRRKTARAQTIEFAECLNLPADNAE